MHEVIYLQIGNLPNFIGTHFWNAQNAYAEDEVDSAVSWSIRETGSGGKNEVVSHPRVMIFDKRGNFGPLQNMSLELDSDTQDAADISQNWSGPTQKLVEELIPPSTYLSRLAEDTNEEEEEDTVVPNPTEVRYWSDYNHVYFTRDSLHPITIRGNPGNADEVNWADGASLFDLYNKENDLMDDSLRRLTEDCDSLQAFQTIAHSPSFGAFGVTLLEKVVDEYPKCGKLDFTILGDYSRIWNVRNPIGQSGGGLLSNAMALYNLSQISDVSVPLLPRSMWKETGWQDLVPGIENSPYHVSAIYAAHIESTTWPIRQQGAGRGFDPMARTLNRDGITPFACLEGIFPVAAIGPLDVNYFDSRLELSLPKNAMADITPLACYDVIRVPSTCRRTSPLHNPTDKRGFLIPNEKMSDFPTQINTFLHDIPHSVVPNLYPIPTSHPQFFTDAALSAETARSRTEVGIHSSLNVRSTFTKVLACHADWVEGYVRRGGDLRGTGIDSDEIKEVTESMRAIIEVYTVDSEDAGSGGADDQ